MATINAVTRSPYDPAKQALKHAMLADRTPKRWAIRTYWYWVKKHAVLQCREDRLMDYLCSLIGR